MKINSFIIGLIELAVIGLMSALAALAFNSSGAAGLLEDFLKNHQPSLIHYIPVILFALAALVGILSVSLAGQAGGAFTWLVILFCLPSFLSFNSFDIPQVFGLDFNIISRLSFYQALGIGVVILTGYILLHFLSVLKRLRRQALQRGSPPDDIDLVHTRSHYILFTVVSAALIVGSLIVLVSYGIESVTLPFLEHISGKAAFIGLGCVIVIGLYVYCLAARRKPL
jgi:hypothetical protein